MVEIVNLKETVLLDICSNVHVAFCVHGSGLLAQAGVEKLDRHFEERRTALAFASSVVRAIGPSDANDQFVGSPPCLIDEKSVILVKGNRDS